MELTNAQATILIGITFFIIYIARKFYKYPLDGWLFILKIIKSIRFILTGIVGFIYFIFPFDIVPDVLVPFGWIDDIGVFLLAHTVFKFISFADKIEKKKQELKERYRDRF